MVLVPTPGKGESKWKKMREIVLLTSYMKGHLRRSSALRQEDAKRRRNAQYMEVLRQGVRNLALLDGSDALLRVRAKKMGGSVAKLVNAGQVIMEVADDQLGIVAHVFVRLDRPMVGAAKSIIDNKI